MGKLTRTMAATAAGALALAACTDADAGEASNVAAYCSIVDEIGDDLPTDEQMDDILDVAPAEIAQELDTIIGAIREDGEAAFTSPEVQENFPAIEAFERENCGPAETLPGTSNEIDPDAQRVDVSATEYTFDFETPTAGSVSFVMGNDGDETHEMAIGRLLGDATIEDLLASEDPEAEGLAEQVAFGRLAAPGGEAVVTVEDLEAGNYAMVCFLPTAEGTPHALEGMAVAFTVD